MSGSEINDTSCNTACSRLALMEGELLLFVSILFCLGDSSKSGYETCDVSFILGVIMY